MITTEELLLKRLDDIDQEIVANSKDTRKALTLLSERDLTARLIGSVKDAPKNNRYVHLLKPVVAVRTYLEERNRPLPEDEIVDGLVAGGWLGGTDHARLTLHKSIKIHTHGTGVQTKKLKKVNELIGLYEWDDSRFAAAAN